MSIENELKKIRKSLKNGAIGEVYCSRLERNIA